jgi:hypothetical protein
MNDELFLKSAAIVCREIAIEKVSILFAKRSTPENDSDSGWQFLCGIAEEDWQTAQVWALGEVLSYDTSLSGLLTLPVGTVLRRSSPNAKWQIE